MIARLILTVSFINVLFFHGIHANAMSSRCGDVFFNTKVSLFSSRTLTSETIKKIIQFASDNLVF
jgi:hypothetical protein